MEPYSVNIFLLCFNQAPFIEEAVMSAVNQDYENLKVVIGDDGSTDGTYEILEKLAARYPERIFLIKDRLRLGITGNCQRTLSYCHADFISFLGGDDIYIQGKVKKQVEWFTKNPDGVLCGHDTQYFDSSSGENLFLYTEKYEPLTSGKGVDYFERTTCPFDAISIMVRSVAIPFAGFDWRIPVCSDWKLWFDILAQGGAYGYIDGVYCKHRITGKNTSASTSSNYNMLIAFKIVKDQYPHLGSVCDVYLKKYLDAIYKSEKFITQEPSTKKSFFSRVKRAISKRLSF